MDTEYPLDDLLSDIKDYLYGRLSADYDHATYHFIGVKPFDEWCKQQVESEFIDSLTVHINLLQSKNDQQEDSYAGVEEDV